MLYLAIDPGDTTGICFTSFDPAGIRNEMYMLDSQPWGDAKKTIIKLSRLWTVRMIVERSPQWKATEKQLSKVRWIINLGKVLSKHNGEVSVAILSPGDWKPIAKARMWRHPEAKDKHQIDAYNLFRYYVWRNFRVEVPYLDIKGKGDVMPCDQT